MALAVFHLFIYLYFFALHDFKCLRHSIVCCEKDEIDFDARVEPARARRVQTAVRYSISLKLVNRWKKLKFEQIKRQDRSETEVAR